MEENQDLVEQLQYLNETKGLIKQAIINKGQSISADDTFRSYVDKINNITTGGSDDIKLFETVEEMQLDPSPNEGDLAVVYREEIQPVTEESEFSSCIFPNEVVLDEAFSGNIYGSFRSTGGGFFDGMVNMSSSIFRFNGYGGSSQVRVQYTSNDGVTYTRTDGGEELQEFGTVIKYEPMEPWNDVIGKFMKIGGNYFEGLYTYKTNIIDKIYVSPKPSTYVNLNVVVDNVITISPELNNIDTENLPKYNKQELNNMLSTICTSEGLTKTQFLMFVQSNGTILAYNTYWNTAFYDINNNYVGVGISIDSSYTDGPIDKYLIDMSNNTYTVLAQETPILFGRFDSSKNVYGLPVSSIGNNLPIFMHAGSSSDAYSANNVGCISADININSVKVEFKVSPYYISNDYVCSRTQLDATPDYVYGKTFYGKNGVEDGTLTTNVSNSFADVNAEVYAKIQVQYNNMQPRILTDQDKDIDSNIRIIPSKTDGTPLLDTSNVTNMVYMFRNCSNLTTIPLLDTSNVTTMGSMFSSCSNLTSIPLLDTSNVTTMLYMFSGCSSLTTIPLLDTSNVTNMGSMFSSCSNLTTIPLLDTSSVTNMYFMFSSCSSLNNESLNNILAMCVNAVKITSNKTLKYIGLTQEQANICTTLSNYQAFTNASWTTGY